MYYTSGMCIYCSIVIPIWNVIMDCTHRFDLICTIMLVYKWKYFLWVGLKVRNFIGFQQGYSLSMGHKKCLNDHNTYSYTKNKPQIYPIPGYFIILSFYTALLLQ